MNLLAAQSSAALPPAVWWVLADAAIKSALLLLAAALLAVLLRKASAAARHLTWSGAVAGTLLLPLLSFLLPAWRAPWLPDWSEVKIAVVSPIVVAPPASVSVVQATTVSVNETASPPIPDAIAPTPVPLWSWALPLWLAGAALALLPLTVGAWQMARLTRRCVPITDADWLTLLARVSADLGLRRRVDLRQGPGVNAPLTWGAWRPVLLLPDAAHAWPAERRRVVLLHELAHIKRWDWLTQTLAYLGCALYWFNPLAWLAARCMRIERERACDDLVLHHGSRPSDYADELLKFAANLGGHGLVNWAAVPMARRSTLEGRLLAILDARRNRSTLTRAAVLAALALVAAVVVPIAMLRAAPDEASTPATSAATPAPTPVPPVSNPPATPSSVILRGTIFSVPPDVHIDPANTSVEQLLSQLSAASSVMITPAPTTTLPVGVNTGFKARNGFHFSNPTQFVVVDFKFHAQVDLADGHLRYQIDSTHTPFPDAAPSPPSTPQDDPRNIAHPLLDHTITIVGNTTLNQDFVCDLGLSGDDPASSYRVLAVFSFQPGSTAPTTPPPPATASDDLKPFVGPSTDFPDGSRLAYDGTKIYVTNNPPVVSSANPVAPLSLTANATSGASIRIFPLPPPTLEFLHGPVPPLSYEWQITALLEKVFQANGVSFGGDDDLYYDTKTSQLVVKSAAANLDRIAAILQKTREQEVIASMETRDFPMPQTTLARLTGFHPNQGNAPGNTSTTDGGTSSEVTDDLKSFFINAGIAFPVGARLAWDGTKIWVTDTSNNLDRLANLLQRYSNDIKQVEIEAKFLEVQQGQMQDLKFRWIKSQTLPGVPPRVAVTKALPGYYNGSPARPDGVTLVVDANAVDPVLNRLNGPGYGTQRIVAALAQTEGAELMSAPKVTVLSQMEAVVIVTGQNISPTTSGAKTSTPAYATDPIGVTFKVLPVVNDDNSVDYSIKATISELVSAQSASGGVVQHTNVTELVTSGHALDGQTIAFDLTGEPPPNPAPSGNTTSSSPPPAPTRHRYAIFTFNLILPGGPPARVPSSKSSPSASNPPPANP